LVVVTATLLLVALLPVLAAVTSTGLLGSAPLYSSMRMSADVAALAKVTVTLFVPAAAVAIFFA
jgi:FlaG/FlaF family flagellin (archaellin)